jgi:hypothetical protein
MFLDKLMLPQMEFGKMTAFEVSRRIQEHIRAAAPLFEPIEQDYNAALCAETFAVLREGGAFGPVEAIPEPLRSEEIHFTFRSPLRDLADQAKSGMLTEGLKLAALASQFDPAQTAQVNLGKAVRDSLRGQGWPAEWLNDEARVAELAAALRNKAEIEAAADAVNAGGAIAEQIGRAGKALAEGGLV